MEERLKGLRRSDDQQTTFKQLNFIGATQAGS